VIEVVADGVPAGLGAPIYGKLDSDLAAAMMSINAVKAVEIGDGMAAATLTGVENADEIRMGPDGPEFLSNHAGSKPEDAVDFSLYTNSTGGTGPIDFPTTPVMDADGYFSIVDRKKDMILVSGFNVYPNEVENVIAMMDEVFEAGVFGVPDAKTGEAVYAHVVPQADTLRPEAVIAHCRKHLAGYKIPKTVELRKELPKSPIGKVLRTVLRAEYK